MHEIVRRGNECVHNVVNLINFTQSQILFQADKFSYSNHVLQETIDQNKILLVLNLNLYISITVYNMTDFKSS